MEVYNGRVDIHNGSACAMENRFSYQKTGCFQRVARETREVVLVSSGSSF